MTESNLPATGPNVDITAALASSILGMPATNLYCIEASRTICATVYANVTGVPRLDQGQVTVPHDSWRLHVVLEHVTRVGPERHLGATGYRRSGYADDTYKPGIDPAMLGLDPVTLSRPIFDAVPLSEARALTTRLIDEGRVTLPANCTGLRLCEDAPFNALSRLVWCIFRRELTRE